MKFSRLLSIATPAWLLAALLSGAMIVAGAARAETTTLTVDLAQSGKAISADLFGIFFEDLNYAADGGLYAELIQNRSFEYSPLEQRSWTPLTAWELTTRGGGKGLLEVAAGNSLNPNNPQYAILDISQVGEGVGIVNSGFDGIALTGGQTYDISLFAKHLYSGSRWSREVNSGKPGPLIVRFESKDGENLGD